LRGCFYCLRAGKLFHVEPLRTTFKEIALKYAKKLDLYGPSVQRDFDIHYGLSLEYARFLPHGATVLDVGSGGGLPGIPIALERPDLRVHLCEIRQRRAAFLRIAVARLGLKNAFVFEGDVRNFSQKVPEPVSWVTAQAVGELETLLELLQGVVTPLEWHLILRRSSSWNAPQTLAGYHVGMERFLLEPETDLIHLTLRGSP
jgi:16S rRNA (guanine527-N7)-methyltransferase